MDPGGTSLQRLGQQVRHEGFAFAGADGVDAMLPAFGGFEDWPGFAASWENLEPDHYLAATGRFRRRRHAVFACELGRATADAAAGASEIRRLPPQPHFQTTTHNPLQGGIERWFAPIEASTIGASFHALLKLGFAVFHELGGAPAADWQVEAHQFRIQPVTDRPGEPTPEGMHRDGVDYVLVALVARHNIESGTTSIHATDGTRLGSFTLTRPRDIALVDDRRVLHGVTAVTPRDPGALAHRDVLVLTYRRRP